jgi:hypothetical protein
MAAAVMGYVGLHAYTIRMRMHVAVMLRAKGMCQVHPSDTWWCLTQMQVIGPQGGGTAAGGGLHGHAPVMHGEAAGGGGVGVVGS